jgi:hypothetical protein
MRVFLHSFGGVLASRAGQSAPTGRQAWRQPEAEPDAIADEAQQAFAQRGGHDQFIHAQ